MSTVQSILIIDDEREFAELLKMRLEANGYVIELARHGDKGLERARELMPNLILLDIMMPGMDGIETLRRLQADKMTCGIPVIMLTAKSNAKVIYEAQALGARGFMVKPCCTADLLREVQRHIRR